MELLNLLPNIYQKFAVFILILTRISTLFGIFILFRRDLVTPRIVIALSSILSIYVLLNHPHLTLHYDIFSIQMFLQMVLQSLLGFVGGLVLNIIFEVVSSFGQILSSQIGLSMASMMDPKLGNITTLTHFYAYCILLIFLMTNSHLVMIKMLLETFQVIPLNYIFVPSAILHDVINYSTIIFNGAIVLAISIVVAILISNVALSTLSKYAPQFNLFSVGINMTLIVGLIYTYVTFNMFIERSDDLINSGLLFFKHLWVR